MELKLGDRAEKPGTLRCSAIRPAQIRLLDEAWKAGISAFLVIGERRDDWVAWLISDVQRARLMRWREGFVESELVLIATGEHLLRTPDRW